MDMQVLCLKVTSRHATLPMHTVAPAVVAEEAAVAAAEATALAVALAAAWPAVPAACRDNKIKRKLFMLPMQCLNRGMADRARARG